MTACRREVEISLDRTCLPRGSQARENDINVYQPVS